MMTVMAMTIAVDSLLSRPKCGCDGGYDVAVKGLSVVVYQHIVIYWYIILVVA